MKTTVKFKYILTTSFLLTLAACSDHTQQQTYQQPQAQLIPAQITPPPQPVIVQQEHSGLSDMLIGGVVGSMLAGRSSQPSAAVATPVIVNKTVNVAKVVRTPPRSISFAGFTSSSPSKTTNKLSAKSNLTFGKRK